MNKICKIHGKEFKGPNSKGNYWHVINFDKQEYCNVPAETFEQTNSDIESEPREQVRVPIKERDYDQENRGKVRNNLVEALISYQGLKPLSDTDKAVIDDLVEFVMNDE